MKSQNFDNGCITDQWSYPNQDQDAKPQSGTSSVLRTQNEDLKDTGVLCTFKIKIKRQNFDNGCITYQWSYPNQDQDAKPQSSVLQTQKWGLKGHWCSLHLQNQAREHKNLDHRCIKSQWPYPNQDRDVKLQLGSSSILQSPKWGLKGHECSLQLQNQDRESKFGSWVS